MIAGRLGAVPYLNAKPLQFGLRERLPEGNLVEAPPSRLAAMLHAGELAAALVSSFACFGRPLRIVPGICIASDGPVQSVKLFLLRPVGEARRIGLHTASLSSAAMAKIVLREQFGVTPSYVSWLPTDRDKADVDGYLLIGDAAMTHRAASPVLDLGEEWRRLTGVPFVYAVWGAPPRKDMAALVELLEEAKQEGIGNIERIARSEAVRLGLDEAVCLRYLRDVIRYDLGERERAGLEVFARKCHEHGLTPQGAGFEFLSAQNH